MVFIAFFSPLTAQIPDQSEQEPFCSDGLLHFKANAV